MRQLLGSLFVMIALVLVGSPALTSHAAAQQKPGEKIKEKIKEAREKAKEKAVTLTFEIYKDAGGDYRFRLKDSDGTLLAMASKGYDSKDAVQKIIDNIKTHAAKAKVEEAADKAKDK